MSRCDGLGTLLALVQFGPMTEDRSPKYNSIEHVTGNLCLLCQKARIEILGY